MTGAQAFALALEHHQAGRLREAEGLYRQILRLQPNHAEVLHHLGLLAHQVGRHDLAVELIRRALTSNPNNPGAHSNLGAALAELGRHDEAVAAYRRALQLKPDFATAHYNLGIVLASQDRFDAAIACYSRALQIRPDYPEAHMNLGNTLREQGRLDEAAAALHRALEWRPNYAEAFSNLGNVLRDQARLDEAIAAYRRAIQLNPSFVEAHGNLVQTMLYHPAFDPRAMREERSRWQERFALPLRPLIKPHGNQPDPSRTLRVGYVSPYFGDQVVGRNLVPLFRHHEGGQFEILCYSDLAKPDDHTEEFRRQARLWRHTAEASHEALAEMIRGDGVDILVDLTQHAAGNRLPMFARQPAPVQVSFAGYPESAGLEAVGYRISDRFLESEFEDRSSEFGADLPSPISDLRPAEQVFLLDSFWCYDPCGIETNVNGLPARKNGWLTFGCLNNFCKINEPLLRLWARVLGKGEDSRLMLLTDEGSHRQWVVDILRREGIDGRRVEFATPCARKAYLDLYRQVDIVLDPFPYSGHTTSLDALWMGVPVVTLAGERPVSRAGLSQLSNLDLRELIAFSEDDYVQIARQLAHDLPRLAELRQILRSRMQASPLMDAARFARGIEIVYRTIWRQWCAAKLAGHAPNR